MKILLIGPVPPEIGGKNKGGVAHHVWELAKALRSKGFEVDILPIGRYLTKKTGVEKEFGFIGGPLAVRKIVVGCFQSVKALKCIRRNITLRGTIHAFVNGIRLEAMTRPLQQYDIIHVHGWYNSVPLLLRQKTHPPLIITVHSHEGLKGLAVSDRKSRFFSETLRCADAVINVSNEDAAVGATINPIFADNSYVAYNGVTGNDESFESSRREGVVFVGRLTEHKRPQLVLQARRNLSNPNIPLSFVGDGPQKKELKGSLRKHEIATFLGSVDNSAARRVMASSELLVVPSLGESFGLVYVEAMVEGAAVIGYGPIIREFQELLEMGDDERALVVDLPKGGVGAGKLSRIMERVLEVRASPEGQAAMVRIAKKAEYTFSWNRVGDRIITIYGNVIERNVGR